MKSNRLRIDEQAGWAEYLIFVDVLLIPNNAIYIITKHLDIEMKTMLILNMSRQIGSENTRWANESNRRNKLAAVSRI